LPCCDLNFTVPHGLNSVPIGESTIEVRALSPVRFLSYFNDSYFFSQTDEQYLFSSIAVLRVKGSVQGQTYLHPLFFGLFNFCRSRRVNFTSMEHTPKNPEGLTVRVHRFRGLPQPSALPQAKTVSLSGRPSVSAASTAMGWIRATLLRRVVSIYHG